jgi:hypothetical protein
MDNPIEFLKVTGSGPLNTTLSAAAAVDNGDGTVKLAVAADIFAAGSQVYIEGTTNYDGLREVVSAPAGYINIRAPFVDETPVGTETIKVALSPGFPFELLEINLHLSVAGATVEDLTLALDSAFGAAYDAVLITKAMNTVQDYVYTPGDDRRYFHRDDVLRFAWANTNARTYGLIAKYRRI